MEIKVTEGKTPQSIVLAETNDTFPLVVCWRYILTGVTRDPALCVDITHALWEIRERMDVMKLAGSPDYITPVLIHSGRIVVDAAEYSPPPSEVVKDRALRQSQGNRRMAEDATALRTNVPLAIVDRARELIAQQLVKYEPWPDDERQEISIDWELHLFNYGVTHETMGQLFRPNARIYQVIDGETISNRWLELTVEPETKNITPLTKGDK